jgi:hypothetical protein
MSRPFDLDKRINESVRSWFGEPVLSVEDYIKELINQEVCEKLREELVAVIDFHENVGSNLPWEMGTGRYIEDRLITIAADK